MKVLFVASEASPFIKTGGLGDVMGALPPALKRLGLDVKVVLPKYKNMKYEFQQKLQFIKWFTVKVGWRNQYCGVSQCEYNGVTYYFLDNEYYFGRDGLYGFYDDAERFAFFDRAVMKFIKEINWQPDIINCNDWQTGMVPVLHKFEYIRDPFYSNIKTIFSIHNLLFQGTYSPEILPELFGYDLEPYYNGSVKIDRELKEEDIHFGLEELEIGDDCLDNIECFKLIGYDRLKKLILHKNRIMRMNCFCSEDCNELVNIELFDNYDKNDNIENEIERIKAL